MSDNVHTPRQGCARPDAREAQVDNRILIVEDDPAIRTLARTVLEEAGYVVDEAHSPEMDGIARPDLVLLDVGFGFEPIASYDAPVLILTAWAAPELVEQALEHGAQGHVQKPFDVGELRDRVAGALPVPVAFAQAA